ncbi:hypothetical protein [Bradyrhizobium tropiciagri]|uniref:hypothetical protein n=1 Tax=Bradyrhizobium tropiciagri TaxID=312253 RepID=UPI002012E2FF|nr:hypothetical protein [Bradyrhizobium tropiciagri]
MGNDFVRKDRVRERRCKGWMPGASTDRARRGAERTSMQNLNAIVSKLNDRLLRLEGELFVLRSIARASLTAGDETAGRTRQLLEGARLALSDEAQRPLDRATTKYVAAAMAMVDELLEQPREAAPLFRVIDGGKRDE